VRRGFQSRRNGCRIWAEIWASSIALAERLAIEAGSGRRASRIWLRALGLVSTVAALRGFEVIATDYYSEALEFTRLQCDLQRPTRFPRHALSMWRDFSQRFGAVCDVVVASDVL